MGDNVTMISPAVPGVYCWGGENSDVSDHMVDTDLGAVLAQLVAEVGTKVVSR